MDIMTLTGRLTEILLSVSLMIQTAEYLSLRAAMGPSGVWAYDVQGRDFKAYPMMDALFAWLSQERVYFWLLLFRALACMILLVGGGSLPLMVFLFVTGLWIALRWRGAFNGGSDFMTMAVMIGCLLAYAVKDGAVQSAGWQNGGWQDGGWNIGLMFIAIQSASSYFISGGVKLLSQDWRTGKALPIFLDGGIYGPLSRHSPFWFQAIAGPVSWAFILWECAIPFALLSVKAIAVFCGFGLLFHLLVFWYFGLNRFVFAWLASYPALFYLASVLEGG